MPKPQALARETAPHMVCRTGQGASASSGISSHPQQVDRAAENADSCSLVQRALKRQGQRTPLPEVFSSYELANRKPKELNHQCPYTHCLDCTVVNLLPALLYHASYPSVCPPVRFSCRINYLHQYISTLSTSSCISLNSRFVYCFGSWVSFVEVVPAS